jgi:hypothetical protein
VDALPGGTIALSTVLPPAQSAEPLVAATVGVGQLAQPPASPHRLTAGTTLTRMVDQFFASQDGSTLSEPLRTDDGLAATI